MTIFIEKFPASKLESRLASLPPIPPGEPRFVYCVFKFGKSGWQPVVCNVMPRTHREALELKRTLNDDRPNHQGVIMCVDETK